MRGSTAARREQAPAGGTSWFTIGAVVLSLLIGTGVLMASIAFSFQRYFEYQIEEGRKIAHSGSRDRSEDLQADPVGDRRRRRRAAGIVKIQAQTMLPATPQRTADGAPHRADADDRAGDRVRGRHRDAERRWRGTA